LVVPDAGRLRIGAGAIEDPDAIQYSILVNGWAHRGAVKRGCLAGQSLLGARSGAGSIAHLRAANQGLVSIVVQKDLIYVNEGDGVTTLSRDPDAMLRQRLGFAIPLTSLRYWVLGVSDPDEASVSLSKAGFRQLGWEVVVDELTPVSGWNLPQKLRVQGAGVRLKILADTWDVKG